MKNEDEFLVVPGEYKIEITHAYDKAQTVLENTFNTEDSIIRYIQYLD